MEKYDFSGWATRNNIRCSDGRTIMKDAFAHNDGKTVPLVWNHQHNDPLNVVGHALLENRDSGVYAYCTLNDSVPGKQARTLVQHGDVTSLSIYANKLQQQGGHVLHGEIRELSLVLAGANPGAYIDSIMHSDEFDEDTGDEISPILFQSSAIELQHADEAPTEETEVKKEEKEEPKMAKEKTVQDVFDELTEEQKNVVYALIGAALEDAKKDGGDDEDMKHNVFDYDEQYDDNVLSHSEMMSIIDDGKRFGSLKESALQHGIENIEYLFPEAKNLNNGSPEWISRDQTWVKKVMAGVHHTPFSRIKSMYADMTGEEARALGYVKGNLKKEEVISLLKRTTSPQTVYKKQKIDRDDVIDITDFDVVAWLKAEMRIMLDEELARAFLFGDGRLASSDDKIQEDHIRPIVKDTQANLFAYYANVAAGSTTDETAKNFIRAAIKARKDYRGSGSPTLYVGADMLSDMLLLEDGFGHALYKTENELATKLRVKEIVEVPDEIVPDDYYGVIVNLADYNVGADKGGAINLFDDFDIDYNQQKYLIETRCSGALIRPKSAIVMKKAASALTPNDNDVLPEGYIINQER